MNSADAVHVLSEAHILLFLVQVFVVLGLAKLLGLLFIRLRQPTVTADILAGLILGPSLLGHLVPGLHRTIFPADPAQIVMLDTMAWLGILFMLLSAGLDVNLSSVWQRKGKATWISISDIVVPIVLSALLLYFLPARYRVDPERRLLFTLFLATIMTISAMPVSIRVMQDLKLLRTDLGFLTVSALSINDVIGWVVFTIILGIFAHGRPDVAFVARLVVLTAVFLALSATAARWSVDRILTAVRRRTADSSGGALTVVSLAAFFLGSLAQAIGIHALFGFFVAGLVSGESRDLTERTRATVARVVYAVFVPVFFANIGLKIDLVRNFDLLLVLVFTVVGIAARYAGAYIGAMFARLPRVQRSPIAALHTPGGEMHIVVAALALDLQLINETVFVAIVVAAVLSSVTLGPWLTFLLRRVAPRGAIMLDRAAAVELKSREKYEALRELCESAASALGLDAAAVYEAARRREEGMSTGLETGLALPHARLAGIPRPVVVLGRSAEGIDWNSPDGLPARLVLFILTPEDESDSQLRIYRQLLTTLSVAETRAAVQQAPSAPAGAEALNNSLRVSALTA